ncbi:hypothetical protein IWW38_006174, partial [Coemansia aciculifera]
YTQTAAATAGSNSGPSGTGTGLDSSTHDSGVMANSPASRDAAAVAAAAVASNGNVLSAADYPRGYNGMSPLSHGQMLPPPPSQYLSQQQQHHQHHQQQQQHHHQQQQQQQHGHHQQQQQQQHGHHQHHHQHHHGLPSIDMNGHAAAAAAVAGYPSSYGLADGTGAGAGGMVSLMSSPTATSWGHGPGSPLSPHNSVSAVAAAAAAAAANQQHQSNGSWYGSMYQHAQYSPTSHGMVMYHDGYATSPTAAAAAAASYYPARARLTTTLWEDEQTLVYQVDCRGICVARRHGK